MGGRMTSNAMARRPLDGVLGLVFLGFPLHPPKQPGVSRAEHLDRSSRRCCSSRAPATIWPISAHHRRLRATRAREATLHVVEGADHSFAVLKRSGRTDAEVMEELALTIGSRAERVQRAC